MALLLVGISLQMSESIEDFTRCAGVLDWTPTTPKTFGDRQSVGSIASESRRDKVSFVVVYMAEKFIQSAHKQPKPVPQAPSINRSDLLSYRYIGINLRPAIYEGIYLHS